VKLRPGLVFYPTRIPTFDKPTRLLPEGKLSTRFEQPGFLEARTRGILRSSYEIFPILLPSQVRQDGPVIGYREFRGTAEVDRRFWRFLVNPSYNLQTDVPFTYAGALSPNASAVYISYAELRGSFGFRDDAISPHAGVYLENAVQYAGLGGDARDVRVEPEARVYLPLFSKDSTLALRAGFGFLFPFNYETYESGSVLSDPPSVKDSQISYFRSFFSGGPSSNRGYPFRGVGPHGPVLFFSPSVAAVQLSDVCDEQSENYDSQSCSFPLGGQSLWEASAEIRTRLSESISSALFCDASDVALNRTTINLLRPHLSCGAGLRYGTPVGPIRLDVGYRVNGLQVLTTSQRNEGNPGSILGLPLNVSFGIGEAF
jgi:outer membrane protein insertion porin family/translocation and assembly module TamA